MTQQPKCSSQDHPTTPRPYSATYTRPEAGQKRQQTRGRRAGGLGLAYVCCWSQDICTSRLHRPQRALLGGRAYPRVRANRREHSIQRVPSVALCCNDARALWPLRRRTSRFSYILLYRSCQQQNTLWTTGPLMDTLPLMDSLQQQATPFSSGAVKSNRWAHTGTKKQGTYCMHQQRVFVPVVHIYGP